MDHQKAFRKTALNTGIVFTCLAAASLSSLIPDPTTAFLVSSVSIHIAALAAMFAVGWPLWLAHLDEVNEDGSSPHTLRDVLSAGRERFGGHFTGE